MDNRHASMKIVIYQKPTCTTCRQAHAALKESGVDFDAVNYYLDPIPKKKLLDLLNKMRMPPRDLLRTRNRSTRHCVSPSATGQTRRSSI